MARIVARNSLFQHLHDDRRRSLGWFGDKEVDMLRHDDESYQGKTVEVAHFVQNLDEEVHGAGRAEQRHAPVTTARDEVQMALSVPALQSFWAWEIKQEP